MASRTDFFFRQKVAEAELDLAFELLEKADRDLAADMGIYGIISGAEPTPHAPVPDLTVDLTAPGRAQTTTRASGSSSAPARPWAAPWTTRPCPPRSPWWGRSGGSGCSCPSNACSPTRAPTATPSRSSSVAMGPSWHQRGTKSRLMSTERGSPRGRLARCQNAKGPESLLIPGPWSVVRPAGLEPATYGFVVSLG